jgi:two-component system, oxyanion-binding sensor
VVVVKAVSTFSLPHRADVHLGFVPLLDAAPLVLALELGYFADEGLQVVLHRQIGWGNVRDKLVYGQIHASHALVGMPPASVLRRDRFPEPVTAIMALGAGGNAVALSRRLADAGVDSAASLAAFVRRRPNGDAPVSLAHVFGCSSHHYLLRDWLATAGGLDPDRDVRLGVLPPPQMAAQMAAGALDGFCAGEPWPTLAEQTGAGRVVAATNDLLPGHPEKVLAVNRRWLAKGDGPAVALVRAVLRACAFCHDAANTGRLADVLARPGYLNVPAGVLLQSLTRGRAAHRPAAATFDPAVTFPGGAHPLWILREMRRWGHVPPETDLRAVANESVNADVYRRAAESLGMECPAAAADDADDDPGPGASAAPAQQQTPPRQHQPAAAAAFPPAFAAAR